MDHKSDSEPVEGLPLSAAGRMTRMHDETKQLPDGVYDDFRAIEAAAAGLVPVTAGAFGSEGGTDDHQGWWANEQVKAGLLRQLFPQAEADQALLQKVCKISALEQRNRPELAAASQRTREWLAMADSIIDLYQRTVPELLTADFGDDVRRQVVARCCNNLQGQR